MHKFILFVILLLVAPVQAQVSTVILSPAPFQIFQRSSDTSGAISISGETTAKMLITGVWGDSILPALYSDINGHFAALWPDLPVWQHDLILTIDGTEYTVPNVGIGDVYIVAGQSNAVGYGRHLQMYISTLGFRAAMFRTDGWQELADPTHNDTAPKAGGSIWPVLATYILEYGVPVAFVPVAVGSTYINQWQPRKLHFNNMTTLIDKLPAPYARAILWQQGEADVKTPARTYADGLLVMATALYKRYSVPIYAAYLFHNNNVNAGIDLAVSEAAYIQYGADLHDLPRDKPPHYVSDENLQIEAWRWYVALVQAGFYSDDHIQ